MKRRRILTMLVLALGLVFCLSQVGEAAPMGTAWTYQGRLLDANRPSEGIYDALFVLRDSPEGPNEVGIIGIQNFDAFDGYFTVELDFGSNVFDGTERWLEVYIRPGDFNDPCEYTILGPRQKITPAPYALFALNGSSGGDGHSLDAADGDPVDAVYVDNEGNVGIGTDTPNSKLDVIEAGPTPSIFAFNAGTGPAIAGESYMGDGVAGESTDPNRSGVSGHSVNGVGVTGRSEENNGVVGWTGAADKSGVYGWSGIGYGVTGRSEAVSGRGIFGVATDTNGVGVYGKSDSGYAAYFEGDTYLGGTVGIGKTEPMAELHIASSNTTTGMLLEHLDATSAWHVYSDSIGNLDIGEMWRASGQSWNRFSISPGGDTWLVPLGGNVGIGTNNPSEKLEVKGGGIRLTDEWSNIYGKNLKIWGEDNSNLLLQSAAGAGNVGVGTIDPVYTLDVDGDIRATGSVYYGGTQGNADGTAYNKPDYVFEEGYHVMSTDQVENYLKKENRLPWMTSAEQEEQQHTSVIDMTRMAFETVETAENLQMQVIQLNKLLKKQGALVRQQQQRITSLEKADIYVEQLHERINTLEEKLVKMGEVLGAVK